MVHKMITLHNLEGPLENKTFFYCLVEMGTPPVKDICFVVGLRYRDTEELLAESKTYFQNMDTKSSGTLSINDNIILLKEDRESTPETFACLEGSYEYQHTRDKVILRPKKHEAEMFTHFKNSLS